MKSQGKKPHRQLVYAYVRGTQWYSYTGLVRFTDGIRARRRAGRSDGRKRNATSWCRRYGAKAPSPLFSASPLSFIFRCAPISFSPLFASPPNQGVPKQKSMNNRRHSPLCSSGTPFPGPLIRCARRFNRSTDTVPVTVYRDRLPIGGSLLWTCSLLRARCFSRHTSPGFGERKRPQTPYFRAGNWRRNSAVTRERFEKFLTTSIYINANIGGGVGWYVLFGVKKNDTFPL